MYMMSENPGNYEVKIIYKGHLVRSIKFAVDAEGKIVDNGIATANKLGNNRVIVPVQVLGELRRPMGQECVEDGGVLWQPADGLHAFAVERSVWTLPDLLT
jgi:hypothetical protein